MTTITHCDLFRQALKVNQQLCSALEHLKEEHGPLRKQMEEIHALAKGVYNASPSEDQLAFLQTLHQKVLEFESALTLHSEKEEGLLFPMMIRYLGHGGGPIAVMEYEHEQAKGYINIFLEQTSDMGETVSEAMFAEMAANVINVYQILSNHFKKEEEVLFPNAQLMLNKEEKDLLHQQFLDQLKKNK